MVHPKEALAVGLRQLLKLFNLGLVDKGEVLLLKL